MTKTTSSALLLALAALAFTPVRSEAGTIAVSPTRLTLLKGSVASLTLRNKSDHPILVQSKTIRWSQVDGRDQYESTNELLLSPPILEIPADGERIMRIAYNGEDPKELEKTYRLILSEVVGAAGQDVNIGVQFAIELNLPVFVLPDKPIVPELTWTLRTAPEPGQPWTLQASNTGSAHIQIRSVALGCGEIDPESKRTATIHKSRYVLQGSTVAWRVPREGIACGVRDGELAFDDFAATQNDQHFPSLERAASRRDENVLGSVSESIEVSAKPNQAAKAAQIGLVSIYANTDDGIKTGRVVVVDEASDGVPIAALDDPS